MPPEEVRVPATLPPEPFTLVRWFVQDGARIAKDEPLFEIETEKANADLSSPVDGVVEQIVPPGTLLRSGQLIGRIW